MVTLSKIALVNVLGQVLPFQVNRNPGPSDPEPTPCSFQMQSEPPLASRTMQRLIPLVFAKSIPQETPTCVSSFDGLKNKLEKFEKEAASLHNSNFENKTQALEELLILVTDEGQDVDPKRSQEWEALSNRCFDALIDFADTDVDTEIYERSSMLQALKAWRNGDLPFAAELLATYIEEEGYSLDEDRVELPAQVVVCRALLDKINGLRLVQANQAAHFAWGKQQAWEDKVSFDKFSCRIDWLKCRLERNRFLSFHDAVAHRLDTGESQTLLQALKHMRGDASEDISNRALALLSQASTAFNFGTIDVGRIIRYSSTLNPHPEDGDAILAVANRLNQGDKYKKQAAEALYYIVFNLSQDENQRAEAMEALVNFAE
ncbi:MAG TPA: hypothetical protein VJR29_03915 [bacterium]|nr:hypothetical protein [bacterium]